MADKNQYFEAKVTAKIKLRRKIEGCFIEEEGFAVRLINGKIIGLNKNQTNSLIFLKEAWHNSIDPEIGEIIIVSEIRNMGKNKRGKDKFRALYAKSKPVL